MKNNIKDGFSTIASIYQIDNQTTTTFLINRTQAQDGQVSLRIHAFDKIWEAEPTLINITQNGLNGWVDTQLTSAGIYYLFVAFDDNLTKITGFFLSPNKTSTFTTNNKRGNVIVKINDAGTIDLILSDLADLSQALEQNTGFIGWKGTGNYYQITTGQFEVLRAGIGYVNSRLVEWEGSQLSSVLATNTLNWIYIGKDGKIGSTTTWSEQLFYDNIILFECLYDGTNYMTVKENHPYSFQPSVSTFLHSNVGTTIRGADPAGANLIRVATGTGASADDRRLKISTADYLEDHGLTTTISAINPITFNVYYTNATGKWIRYAQQSALPMYYNRAGTMTALATSGASSVSVFTIYVSKDDLNSTTPTYYAVAYLNATTAFGNTTAAQTAINNGTVSYATNELKNLELCQLGYALVTNNVAGGYIFSVTIQKSTFNSKLIGGGTSSLASSVDTDVTNFDHLLSSSDSTVQQALETLDEIFNYVEPSIGLYDASSGATFSHYTNNTTGITATDGFSVGIDASEKANIWNYENTDMLFGTNNTLRATLSAAGTLNIVGDITSNTDKAYILGATGYIGIGVSPTLPFDVTSAYGTYQHAVFGSALSAYICCGSGSPIYGFNMYRDAGGVKFGRTSSSNWGGYITLSGSTGSFSLNISNAVGNADAALTAVVPFTANASGDIKLGLTGGKQGFYGSAGIVKPAAMTTALTTVTFTAPGTPDYAWGAGTNTNAYGWTTNDEFKTAASVIANLQARVNEIETNLKNMGLFT